MARVAAAEKDFLAASVGLKRNEMSGKLGIGWYELKVFYDELAGLKLVGCCNDVVRRLDEMK
jgi:hypothetical protein